MSALSQRARSQAKEKVSRLVHTDPSTRVDASGYRPDGEMMANVKTGMRPVSRRAYRRGGTVEGEKAPRRADRKPRASGGRAVTADSLVNRNVKDANEKRVGDKFEGGLKHGGRAHKLSGGPLAENTSTGTMPPTAVEHKAGGRVGKLVGGALTPQQRMALQQRATIPAASAPTVRRPMMRASGGKTHADAAQDRKLIHDMGCKCSKCEGGRVERARGGPLTAKTRNALPSKDFALPGRRYPIQNPNHARNALARVSQHGTPEEKAEVRSKVHSKYPDIGKKARGGPAINDGTRPTGGRMARKGGGRTKKGTNVNIIIAPQPSGPGAIPPRPAMPPPGPVGMRQGVPPPVLANPMQTTNATTPGMAGGPPVTTGMPARAQGGRTMQQTIHTAKPGSYPIDSGAGGGQGRLEKAHRAARA